jgi:asparagine synthase (glutamine-hydrolysing)
MPIAEWLRTDLRNFIDELLCVDRLERDGLFDTARVREMLEAHLAGTRDYRKPLWTLLAFHVWLDSSLATP